MVTGRRRESRRRLSELCYWLTAEDTVPDDWQQYIDRGAMPTGVTDIESPEAQALLAKVAAYRERCVGG